MKTPSGKVHVGALRGVIIHALINRALIEKEVESINTYVINDMDPMDGFPHYLPESFKKYMGEPLYRIPSPEKGHKSMAKLYGQEFIDVFNKLGFKPKIIWSSEWYQQGKFDKVIKQALNNKDKIRDLYKKVSDTEKPKNWYPYQVICPECGKVGTTIVIGWDGKKVKFECKKDLVNWAEGCGNKGKIEPIGDNGKLMWKTDWAAHWKVIGVTVEGAGKDHMTEGGSHDQASAICEQVFDYKTPFNFLYEWFLAKGGVKMSSSKGIGTSAVEISKTLPAEILNYLLIKTPYKKAIVFDPNNNDSILNLFDDYDKAAKAYYKEGTKNPAARAWELSQIDEIAKKAIFLPRFRDVINYDQLPSVDIKEKFREIKGKELTDAEKKELDKRIKYARIWLKQYAPEKKVLQITSKIPDSVKTFTNRQQSFLSSASIATAGSTSAEKLQQDYYDISKKEGLEPKQAFGTIYQALLGKDYGPKAGWLGHENKKVVSKRLKEAAEYTPADKEIKGIQSTKTDLIKLDSEFVEKYPSASVGFALIEGVKVEKFNADLEKERQKFAKSLSGITTEELNQLPKILSYRKMYKEMGVNWHSKRPSPEALLRRIALGKGLYNPINVIVDAYNLVVMRNKVSCGAFDADQIKAPSEVKIAQGGEKALYIGDKEETVLKSGEVCYFDQIGPYNIDYNYRDAIRSLSTEKTQNAWVNTEGIYEITPKQVKKTLDEAIEIIIKYCGGQVKEKGMLIANG